VRPPLPPPFLVKLTAETLHRCARNCFQCPQCDHTLSVVASDPDPSIPLNSAAASVGEPPYFLTCNFCRWDSKEVGITFEKPTSLARTVSSFPPFLPC
jgi:dynactin-4